ncbi:Retrovirus-related Pol polyprotein from transposon TNT 1-94 [Senna tora]|uniref:Retrovirus-related Pol polyprotein from transposon TNT 1-94 n=1 Tax=Senna tora TaxID=362788 RepID=A0A834SLZ1_9FABA|nr:Retrovirus-related Pol polyprotein from transposon TNT 1-94 [Senna tora]
MTNSGSTSSSTSSTTPAIITTATAQRFGPHPISVKLDDSNYLPWKQQALATIKGYKLQQYILGAKAIPKQFSSPEDEAQGKINDDFLTWEQQDQLLLSWILSSVSDGLLPKLVGCSYSYQAWEKLEHFFASQTRAKVRQFKAQLRNLKKGTSSANEYLLKIKKLVDALFSVGSPVSEADHIEAILEGLSEEYNSFVVSVTSRSDPYTVDEIESLLVAQEERLDKFKKDSESVAPMSANLVQSQAKGGKPNSSSGQNKGQYFNNNNNNNTRGGFRGGRGRNGRGGRGNTSGGSRPQCQVCSKVGHMAWQCYYRFDQQFISPFSMGVQSPSSSSSSGNFRPNANMATMDAMYPSSDYTYDAAWYPDSGATNHVTPQYNNLGSSVNLTGNDQINMANGAGISIQNVGTTEILSPQSNSSFLLNHVLHAPKVSKNLLSVSQFTKDNSVFFEFHSNACYVKCQDTKRILMQGIAKDGLYVFDNLKLLLPSHSVKPVSASHRYQKSQSVEPSYSFSPHMSSVPVPPVLSSSPEFSSTNINAPVCTNYSAPGDDSQLYIS